MKGIYKITNNVNGKVYIGQSLNIENRLSNHFTELNHNKHQNQHLQNSYNKYGKDNFSAEIIEECEVEDLDRREQYWIDYYGGVDSNNNFNQRFAGSHGSHTKETKEKISKSQKGKKEAPGRKVSEDGRKRLSLSHMGIKPSIETRKKMSEAQKGRKHTEESKQLISQKMKEFYKNNPELIEKISERRKNMIITQETRDKISKSLKGKKFTQEQKNTLSKALKQAYREGRGKLKDKQTFITIFGITKNLTEWSEFADCPRTVLSAKNKKDEEKAKIYLKEHLCLKLFNDGELDSYIESILNNKS